jgi:hypothetical protein
MGSNLVDVHKGARRLHPGGTRLLFGEAFESFRDGGQERGAA